MHLILTAIITFVGLVACTHNTADGEDELQATQLEFDDYSIALDEDVESSIYSLGSKHRYSIAFEAIEIKSESKENLSSVD